jgi:hypothetical protein
VSYQEATGHAHPDGPDIWISSGGIDSFNVLPGMPKVYLKDVLEGRALYVLGVPLNWQLPAFKEIFRNCGEVLKCPCVIDINSEQVFRWVIMNTPEEAAAAMRDLDGLQLLGQSVHLCRALPPGATFIFREDYPLKEFLKWHMNPPPITTQGVHSDPIIPALPQQPVAVVIQPPTPASVHANATQPDDDDDDKQQPPAVLQPKNPVKQGAKHTIVNIDDDFVPQAVSWANIVSARGGPRTMDMRAQSKPAGSNPRLQTIGRIPSINRTQVAETVAEQMRVVFLLDIPKHVTLTNISDAIKEGSLVGKIWIFVRSHLVVAINIDFWILQHSIRFGIDENEGTRYAGIIFQNAHEAEVFFKVITKEHAESKPDRLPFVVHAVRGDPFPSDNMLKLMRAPTFASRRLTIVKSKFFFMYKEDEFRRFCENIVGPDQIQCLWLYNGGNATVVFSDVNSAVMLKEELDRLSGAAVGEDDNFFGLQVSYSKDPCLQEIHFVTDLRN